MALREDFPSKDLLEGEGYKTESDVAEATDEELLAIDGIGPVALDKIRQAAPFTESSDASGTGQTSGVGPSHTLEPTSQSFQEQTSNISKDQTDPSTGQNLPKGLVKNARGTITASSTVDQPDMFSPEKLAEERKNRLRQMGERISAALEG